MGAVEGREQAWQEMKGEPEAVMMDEKSILLRGIKNMCVSCEAVCVKLLLAVYTLYSRLQRWFSKTRVHVRVTCRKTNAVVCNISGENPQNFANNQTCCVKQNSGIWKYLNF